MRRRSSHGRLFSGLCVGLVLTLFAACGGGQELQPGFNLFTPEEDVEIGRESAGEILESVPVLAKPEIEAYLDELGARLASRAPGEKFPYEFRILNLKEVNAFALPGGIVFVNRGTLDSVRDEGELAGILAHEVSHVALRHGTNQLSKAHVAARGLHIFGRVFGGSAERSGDARDVVEGLGGLGLNTIFLKFSREAETEADLAAARILAETGYDPIEMARFFDTLGRGNETPEFLSDHPSNGNRAQAVADVRGTLAVSPTPITVTDGFWRMKSALRLLPPAASMRNIRVGPEN